MTTQLLSSLLAAAFVLAACSGEPDAGGTASDVLRSPSVGQVRELSVIPQASYDLAVGTDQRLIFGAALADRTLIGGGTLNVQVISLASADATTGTLVSQGPASFLPVPGMEPEQQLSAPTSIDGRASAGVYQLRTDLPEAGLYGLQVSGELADGTVVQGSAVFNVAAQHMVVAPGQDAPRTDNPTVDDDVPLVELDSCAQEGNPCNPGDPYAEPALQFPWLYETRISDSIAAGRPLVVLVSTPVFCVSRFCGPITGEVAALAQDYADRADFVHLEVWKDFQNQVMNDAAAEWIQHPDGSATEPWTFLVGADGTITQRWGNVLDIDELEGLLQELPPLGG